MRIELNSGTQPATESSRSSTPGSASTASPSASSAAGEDQAQLSGAHLQVQALAAQAAQLPELRQERVQALRLAIQGGSYDPGAEQVAGAMLTEIVTAA